MPLLMIPGPVPVSEDVLAALALPVRSHTSADNAATVRSIQAGVRACVGSADARVHVFAGAGTLAMEAAIVNFAGLGDRVVVCSHGFFGDRFADIAAAFGIDADVVRSEWGGHVDMERVRRACANGRPPALVAVTHVDTSSGVLADAQAIASCCADSGALLVLDGVCATGGIVEAMDAWGYDVVLTGAQKALGVPPGLAIVAVSEAARRRRGELGRVPAYYADLARWDPVVDDPTRYFSTHATSMLRALEVSLDAIAAEGLQRRFARHERVADSLREGMAGLGFSLLTQEALLAPTLSVLAVPAGVDEAQLRADMAEAGVIVAGCLGAFAGRGIRIGHMGKVDAAEVEATLAAAAAALARQRGG
jgi:alanine-glyoxylate transaminase / serine-glyoxylate transaminase / serine-pyruvate transaminase